jgi:CubicO group peptidase (beta-lactamase class C family)
MFTTVRCVALLVLATGSFAADVPKPSGPRDDMLDPAFRLVREAVQKNDVPGAIALVTRNGTILRHEAFGLRDIENQLPFTTNTLCWIASITKPVTVAAAMTLVDAGKLALDDRVEKYLPEFAQQTDTNGAHQAITIRQLMSHTSGLVPNPPTRRSAWPIGGPLDDFWLQQNFPEIVRTIAESRLRFKPGSKFEYSNSALFVLGRIIEVVSGKPYAAYVKEKIFDPLGVADTHYAPPSDQGMRVAKIYAQRDGQRETIFHFKPALKISNTAPDGGLFSYPAQLVPFLQLFLDNDGRVLSRSAVAEMLTPQPHGWGLAGRCKTACSCTKVPAARSRGLIQRLAWWDFCFCNIAIATKWTCGSEIIFGRRCARLSRTRSRTAPTFLRRNHKAAGESWNAWTTCGNSPA